MLAMRAPADLRVFRPAAKPHRGLRRLRAVRAAAVRTIVPRAPAFGHSGASVPCTSSALAPLLRPPGVDLDPVRSAARRPLPPNVRLLKAATSAASSFISSVPAVAPVPASCLSFLAFWLQFTAGRLLRPRGAALFPLSPAALLPFPAFPPVPPPGRFFARRRGFGLRPALRRFFLAAPAPLSCFTPLPRPHRGCLAPGSALIALSWPSFGPAVPPRVLLRWQPLSGPLPASTLGPRVPSAMAPSAASCRGCPQRVLPRVAGSSRPCAASAG
jgi:hypothetical protein